MFERFESLGFQFQYTQDGLLYVANLSEMIDKYGVVVASEAVEYCYDVNDFKERGIAMKCDSCGCFDSWMQVFYVDRNGNYFSESELEAFYVLHPEARTVSFDAVYLCGLCAYEKGK